MFSRSTGAYDDVIEEKCLYLSARVKKSPEPIGIQWGSGDYIEYRSTQPGFHSKIHPPYTANKCEKNLLQ